MIDSKTLRLVLLVSCCHALVHVYELSFASVEQLVAGDFGVDTAVTGWLGTALRLPFGFCAIVAGWLADRFGAKRLLLVYLVGCSFAAMLSWLATDLSVLFVAMFTLGLFASIYHPAGVALISHHTRPENRPRALSYHGIFGSAGIATGPFVAAMVLAGDVSWRKYYLVLTVPGVLLAVLLSMRLSDEHQASASSNPDRGSVHEEDGARWDCYFLLILVAMLAGFVYAAVLTFLPRYLAEADLNLEAILDRVLRALGIGATTIRPVSVGNFLTGVVLVLGILGQYAAGRIGRPHTLEPLLAMAFLATVPFLFWMGFAEGVWRVWAAGLFAPFFFMHQPLYNSLVAKYVPRRRRSFAYGLSFAISFGVGSLGSAFAGKVRSLWGGNEYQEAINYGTLAALALAAGLVGLILWRKHRSELGPPEEPPGPLANGTVLA